MQEVYHFVRGPHYDWLLNFLGHARRPPFAHEFSIYLRLAWRDLLRCALYVDHLSVRLAFYIVSLNQLVLAKIIISFRVIMILILVAHLLLLI